MIIQPVVRTLALLTAFLGIAALGSAMPRAQAATLTVTVGHSIQDAIDAASPGDTITIGPGTYAQSIVVWQDDLTIVGNNTVIRPTPGGRPFGVCVSYSPGCLSFFGSVSHDTITGITVEGIAGDGFLVLQADNVTLRNDQSIGNLNSGFGVERASSVTLTNDRASRNGFAGFAMIRVDGLSLTNDAASDNHGFGFSAVGVTGMALTGSVARTNCAGVVVESSSRATIAHSIFAGNTGGCPEVTDEPSIAGDGAVIDQSDRIRFTHNALWNNGTSTVASSGGLAVSRSPSSAANLVEANAFGHNAPVDIRVDDVDPATNNLADNACRKSDPIGLC